MAGLRPIFTQAQVKRWIDRFGDRAEQKMIMALQQTGEYFVTRARETGNYNNDTGNLRSSIGYVIARDGQTIFGDFQPAGVGTDQKTGVGEAKRLASSLALTHNKGLVLIGVAGMDYAVHVENMENKDVISSSESKAKRMLKQMLKEVLDD
ncbi:MAG: hypothetical protein AVO38_15935 [delta proteobacterium ML8_D]|jgi:hypothetical protein|nr:MAG: hypothetical protein AVO38_15935 [delta proteobacterium ML8_D]